MENLTGFVPMVCKDRRVNKSHVKNQIQIQCRGEQTQQILDRDQVQIVLFYGIKGIKVVSMDKAPLLPRVQTVVPKQSNMVILLEQSCCTHWHSHVTL
jgi:hypothetical protein